MNLAFGKPVPPANNLVLFPLVLTVFFWLWSVSNASGRAKSVHRPLIDRPVPPVDKDYEI
jgi:hypothetical protein